MTDSCIWFKHETFWAMSNLCSLIEGNIPTLFSVEFPILVSWDCRIHRLLFCWGVRPTNECPGYDNKQSDCEVPVMLELWVMQRISLLPSLPGLLWTGVVAPDRVLSMGQIELNWVLMLNWIVWNRTFLISNCELKKLRLY